MATEVFSGSFSPAATISGIDVVLAEGPTPNPPSTPERTPGAFQVASLNIRPTLLQSWEIQSWSCALTMAWAQQDPGFNTYGKLGRIMAGPFRAPPIPGYGAGGMKQGVPFAYPIDISNLATLWDGSQDDLPSANWSCPSAITTAQNLASPIAPEQGEQLTFFLGLTPSVGQNFVLVIVNASWSITVEETTT